MSRVLAASGQLRRTVLAFGLCFLAFSFAMEAKLAWYGPQGGFGSDVRAAKALPADVPALVPHGAPAPDPIHPLISFALLLAFAAGCALADVLLENEAAQNHLPVSAASYFSPHNFFRPPPAR
jgi:hypothetical protein